MAQSTARRNLNRRLTRRGWVISNSKPSKSMVFFKPNIYKSDFTTEDGQSPALATDISIRINPYVHEVFAKESDIVVSLTSYMEQNGVPNKLVSNAHVTLTFEELELLYHSIKDRYES